MICKKKRQLVLLYPSEQATMLSAVTMPNCVDTEQNNVEADNKFKPLSLVIIDGTWKKAYRMFTLSKKNCKAYRKYVSQNQSLALVIIVLEKLLKRMPYQV
jgi:hypothetical protein